MDGGEETNKKQVYVIDGVLFMDDDTVCYRNIFSNGIAMIVRASLSELSISIQAANIYSNFLCLCFVLQALVNWQGFKYPTWEQKIIVKSRDVVGYGLDFCCFAFNFKWAYYTTHSNQKG